jgi:hypothetical protein
MRRFFLRPAAVLAAAIAPTIAAGGPSLASAASVTAPAMAQLMAIVFPGWDAAASTHVQTVPLPHMPGFTRAGAANWHAGPNQVLAEPQLVLRTDAAHLTLVAGLVPADDKGKPEVSHVLPMALAAYQFEQRGGSWALAGRQDVFALRGFFGEARLRAVELAGQRQAVAVEYGSCWQGYCGTWLALYELNKDKVSREPVVEMALSGTNVDGAADCMRRLQPLVKPHPQDAAARDEGIAPDSHDCYAIESSWAIEASRGQPGDLVIHYQGAMSRADAHAAPPVAIDQRQVLRYAGGKYRAVSGFNPVPSI